MGPVSRTKCWLLALYLGTAPVQWLPGVDYEWVVRAKVVLFVLAVGAVLLGTSPTRLRLPLGLAGPLGFAALAMLSIPGLAQSNLGPSAGYLADVVYGATMLWCFYNVARLDDVAAKKTFERSAVIVAAFAVAALGLTVAGSGWQSPCGGARFHDTAFGCSRTGWSGGLALYLPILMVFVFPAGYRRAKAVAVSGLGGQLGRRPGRCWRTWRSGGIRRSDCLVRLFLHAEAMESAGIERCLAGGCHCFGAGNAVRTVATERDSRRSVVVDGTGTT